MNFETVNLYCIVPVVTTITWTVTVEFAFLLILSLFQSGHRHVTFNNTSRGNAFASHNTTICHFLFVSRFVDESRALVRTNK